MIRTPIQLMAVIAVAAAMISPSAKAGDLKLTFPARSKYSPVQRLNREGVEAVNKKQYQKAEQLFYKAYLYDPTDPFTLNNLGFIAEQQGLLDRAHKFYALAAEQGCSAPIDVSNSKSLLKKPMTAALEGLDDRQMRVNRMNVEAMRLLSQDRTDEAAAELQQAQALDPRNPFTLNNLAVADEATGDIPAAFKNYALAAATRSSEPVIVTLDHSWSGKPVSEMAEASAKRLQDRLGDRNSSATPADLLNMRGVYAANANDWSVAKQDFLKAYSLDPRSAFSLNNRGYVAEQEGDLESAQFFYQKARRANDANSKIGFATAHVAEGRALSSVATESDRKVDGALDTYSRQRHSQAGAIELTPRGEGASSAPTQQQPQPTQQQPQ
jgi:Flp pilus assembly protein TadD